jgi:hypothetical protein
MWIFDIRTHFVLDSTMFSSIIYILYEGGPLSPPVVMLGHWKPAGQPCSKEELMAKKSAKGGKKKGGKKR